MIMPSHEDLVIKQAIPAPEAGSRARAGPSQGTPTHDRNSRIATHIQAVSSPPSSVNDFESQRPRGQCAAIHSAPPPVPIQMPTPETPRPLLPRMSSTSLSSRQPASAKQVPLSKHPPPPLEVPRPVEVDPAHAEPAKKPRVLPGPPPVKEAPVDRSWGAWLTKKVVPKVVGYVFGGGV